MRIGRGVCLRLNYKCIFKFLKLSQFSGKQNRKGCPLEKKDTSSYGCISVYEQIVMYATT